MPPPGPSAGGPSMGWGGGGWGGIPYGYISILDIGYWIYILSSRSCDKYRNIFWIFDMHLFLSMLSWFLSIFSVFHLFSKRPKRCARKFYVKSRLNFCVSSVLDPIGDQILLGLCIVISCIPILFASWRPQLVKCFRALAQVSSIFDSFPQVPQMSLVWPTSVRFIQSYSSYIHPCTLIRNRVSDWESQVSYLLGTLETLDKFFNFLY
jgi:hypothetical protein